MTQREASVDVTTLQNFDFERLEHVGPKLLCLMGIEHLNKAESIVVPEVVSSIESRRDEAFGYLSPVDVIASIHPIKRLRKAYNIRKDYDLLVRHSSLKPIYASTNQQLVQKD